MSEHPPARALRRGLYLDAQTTGPGCAHETPWLEWELGVPGLDRSIHRHSPASHGLDECKLGVWMLAQPLADSSRWMLALVLDHSQVRPGRGPASARLQSPRWP